MKAGMPKMLKAALAVGVGLVAMVPASSAMAASHLNDPVPADHIVTKGGLDWVWASPCANNGCSSVLVGKDGFNYATPAQWAQRPAVSEFGVNDGFDDGSAAGHKCSSAWFDAYYNHCDGQDPGTYNAYGSAPAGGLPSGADGNQPMLYYSETWLVRVHGGKKCATELAAYYAAVQTRDEAYDTYQSSRADVEAKSAAYYADRTPANKAALQAANDVNDAARADFVNKKAAAQAAYDARVSCLNPPSAVRKAVRKAAAKGAARNVASTTAPR